MVPTVTKREELTRRAYRAYETGDRALIEDLLSEDFTFSSPPDPQLNRAQYFERCWPNAELIQSYDFVRLVEKGDEVIVTYESTKSDGKRFRNTEVLTFRGDQICRAEVYFGWDVPE
jgi:ketosteroid isomerase-like protein